MTQTPDPFAAPVDAAAPPTSEVRRCSACGRDAMICASTYEGTAVFGLVGTGPTDLRDFICQGCGVGVTLHPVRWIYLPLALSGAPLLLIGTFVAFGGIFDGNAPLFLGLGGVLILGGLGMVGTLAWPIWLAQRHPRVPGADLPPVRFYEAWPRRRCRCGQAAPCRKVVASRTNGVYTGTEYTFVCACGQEFTVESLLATVLSLTGGLVVSGIAAAILPGADASWGEIGGFLFFALLGLGTLGVTASRSWARWKHPPIPVGVAP